MARLYAAVYGITYSQQVKHATCTYILDKAETIYIFFSQDLSLDTVLPIILATPIPPFKPSSKVYTYKYSVHVVMATRLDANIALIYSFEPNVRNHVIFLFNRKSSQMRV